MTEHQHTPQWYDSMYNNGALVPAFPRHVQSWIERSEQARQGGGCVLDIPYGDGQRERLDVFPAANANAPVLVFIHGGYWRSMSKAESSFIGAALAHMGACAVVPDYALCPGTPEHPVAIPQIVLQMVQALAWTWRNIARYGGDPSRITVAGHSAGGHLTAMLMTCDWKVFDPALPANLLRNGLSISGLHELESIRRTPYLQTSLRLSAVDALRASPACMPAPRSGVLNAVVGGAESPEFLRQNQLIQSAWGKGRVPVCEALDGLNHFSVLEALVEPGTRLNALVRGLLGLA
ncbi:MAG: alpha/beta hydrolase [Burkholderiaceae bacterium]